MKLLNTAEVARRLGVSRQRVAQYVKEGRLRPAVPVTARQGMWFLEEEVARFEREPKRRPGRKRREDV